MELKIVELPVKSLKMYERNARKHSEVDINAIAASIRDFGFDDPIGIWGKKNIIVEGHGRLLAAQQLGIKKVPCIRLDHLSDDERKAYALAHNKTAELSEWDNNILEEELDKVTEHDMREYGFDEEFEQPDLSDMFIPSEPKEKEPKTYTCPHCGASVEV